MACPTVRQFLAQLEVSADLLLSTKSTFIQANSRDTRANRTPEAPPQHGSLRQLSQDTTARPLEPQPGHPDGGRQAREAGQALRPGAQPHLRPPPDLAGGFPRMGPHHAQRWVSRLIYFESIFVQLEVFSELYFTCVPACSCSSDPLCLLLCAHWRTVKLLLLIQLCRVVTPPSFRTQFPVVSRPYSSRTMIRAGRIGGRSRTRVSSVNCSSNTLAASPPLPLPSHLISFCCFDFLLLL